MEAHDLGDEGDGKGDRGLPLSVNSVSKENGALLECVGCTNSDLLGSALSRVTSLVTIFKLHISNKIWVSMDRISMVSENKC